MTFAREEKPGRESRSPRSQLSFHIVMTSPSTTQPSHSPSLPLPNQDLMLHFQYIRRRRRKRGEGDDVPGKWRCVDREKIVHACMGEVNGWAAGLGCTYFPPQKGGKCSFLSLFTPHFRKVRWIPFLFSSSSLLHSRCGHI